MNILLVTPFYSGQSGGVATYVQDMKRLLTSRGHNVYVLRPGEPELIQACILANENDVFEFNLRVPWISSVPIRGSVAFLYLFLGHFMEVVTVYSSEEDSANLVRISAQLYGVFLHSSFMDWDPNTGEPPWKRYTAVGY